MRVSIIAVMMQAAAYALVAPPATPASVDKRCTDLRNDCPNYIIFCINPDIRPSLCAICPNTCNCC
ncbi:hypothetical protein B0T14DRAFT_508607 [Immersiella caudata]|uniref:ShKT domain-containing protein n=1 Tax=Immersiella caudata TaxID=314043 RepID=A0AA40C553_9PEZI|nr:hypothetical protein B0T14DRAFT_508607 [Immersiella caudata]